MWQEKSGGYFFPRGDLSAAVRTKLEALTLDGAAQIDKAGVLLPFEKSLELSEEDAELLSLPPRNPYQVSIRTTGYIGRNFRYVVELLSSDGRPLKPQINGALVHVGENIFRLTAAQFALIKLTELGNQTAESCCLSSSGFSDAYFQGAFDNHKKIFECLQGSRQQALRF